ncbi:DUF6036 family nucleotidyltransferase [Candidatus Omnitrophota bacterium]
MEYRLNKKDLLDTLGMWNSFLKKKVHLIACGGTALTLLDIKASTKDVDFIVPVEAEYDYLMKILPQLGYRQTTGSGWAKAGELYIYDLFRGKKVHTTELLESPLEKEGHILLKELTRIYIGVLNHYDLVITKLFRSTSVDIDDCLSLIRARRSQIDIKQLCARFKETAKYDVSEDKLLRNLGHFLEILKKVGIYG